MPPPRPDQLDPVQRRIRAAMAIAGYDFPQLADAIGLDGLGETTLRKLNATKATRLHLEPIARACRLPYEFFTTPDFDELGGRIDETKIDRVERLIRQHDRDTKKAMTEGAELQSAVFATQRMVNQNSDQIDRILGFIQELAMTELVELLQQAADQRAGTSGGSSGLGDAAGGGGLG